jgi:hypothetical protein
LRHPERGGYLAEMPTLLTPKSARSTRPAIGTFPSVAVTLALLATTLVVSPAWGQDRSAAAALFEKGLGAMKAKDFTTACPALAESQRLDPLPGTLFTLAECEAGAGRSASAILHYNDFIALVATLPADAQKKQKPRLERTKKQVEGLEKTVPHLTLVLPKDAPKGATVKRDGKPVAEAIFGVKVAVDPGDHTVTTEAPGRASREQKVKVSAGADQSITLTFSAPAAAATAASTEPTADPPPTSDEPPLAVTSSGSSKTAGYVVLGLGAAFTVAGGVTGALAFGKKGDVDDNCRGNVCNAAGKSAGDSMKSLATISNIGFGVGIVGLAVGTVLLVRSPKKTTAFTIAPTMAVTGPRDGFGGVVGRF